MPARISRALLSLCALALAACAAPVSQTSREPAAVETERVSATQAVAQTRARATWDAQNVTLRQLDIEQTALAVRRGIVVLEMTRAAAPANATSTAVANAAAAANIVRANDAWSAGLLICGGALVVLLLVMLFHFNEWVQARRIAAKRITDAQTEQRVNEMRLIASTHIVTETTPDADANHIAAWRSALIRCIEWGQLVGFAESEWRRRAIVYYPEDPEANDDAGRRSLMGLLDGMGVTWATRGRERTWAAGWSADTPLSEFARLPLPSELPDTPPPAVKIALRSAEAGELVRSSEAIEPGS